MAAFSNRATLSYRDTVTNSNVVTGEITEVLSADKTAVYGAYSLGDTVTYVISIVNSGTTPFTGLTVTDNLGAFTVGGTEVIPLTYEDGSVQYYVNGVLQAPPTVSAAGYLVISGIGVPANGNALIIYSATVNEYAPLEVGGTITNQAAVTGGGLTNDLIVTETVDTEEEAELSITKSLSPTVVAENGQLTYTFVIRNTGNTPAVATDNVTVRDVFDPVLNPITVTFNGAVWTAGVNYTYDAVTGVFETVPGQITVPAATYTRDPVTGIVIAEPGIAVLTVTGTV